MLGSWICNEGAQMASLFHSPNSIAYYSTRFLPGVSLWGTWNSLPHGRRTESIVVTWCWQIKSRDEIMASKQTSGTDCYEPVVTGYQMQKCDVALDWQLRWNTSLPVLAVTSWPLTVYCQQCHPASPTDTQSTMGDSWLWQETWNLACLFNPLMSKNSSRRYVLLSSWAANALVPKQQGQVISTHMASMVIVQHP